MLKFCQRERKKHTAYYYKRQNKNKTKQNTSNRYIKQSFYLFLCSIEVDNTATETIFCVPCEGALHEHKSLVPERKKKANNEN